MNGSSSRTPGLPNERNASELLHTIALLAFDGLFQATLALLIPI
jgi:hypothetical protein